MYYVINCEQCSKDYKKVGEVHKGKKSTTVDPGVPTEVATWVAFSICLTSMSSSDITLWPYAAIITAAATNLRGISILLAPASMDQKILTYEFSSADHLGSH